MAWTVCIYNIPFEEKWINGQIKCCHCQGIGSCGYSLTTRWNISNMIETIQSAVFVFELEWCSSGYIPTSKIIHVQSQARVAMEFLRRCDTGKCRLVTIFADNPFHDEDVGTSKTKENWQVSRKRYENETVTVNIITSPYSVFKYSQTSLYRHSI